MPGTQNSNSVPRRADKGLIFLYCFSWHFFFWSGLAVPYVYAYGNSLSARLLSYSITGLWSLGQRFLLYTFIVYLSQGWSIKGWKWLTEWMMDVSCSELNSLPPKWYVHILTPGINPEYCFLWPKRKLRILRGISQGGGQLRREEKRGR